MDGYQTVGGVMEDEEVLAFQCTHCQTNIPSTEDNKHPVFLRDELPRTRTRPSLNDPSSIHSEEEISRPRIIDVLYTVIGFRSSSAHDPLTEESLSLCTTCLDALDSLYTAFQFFVHLDNHGNSYILKNSSLFTPNPKVRVARNTRNNVMDYGLNLISPARPASAVSEYYDGEPEVMTPVYANENSVESEDDIESGFRNVLDEEDPLRESESEASTSNETNSVDSDEETSTGEPNLFTES